MVLRRGEERLSKLLQENFPDGNSLVCICNRLFEAINWAERRRFHLLIAPSRWSTPNKEHKNKTKMTTKEILSEYSPTKTNHR